MSVEKTNFNLFIYLFTLLIVSSVSQDFFAPPQRNLNKCIEVLWSLYSHFLPLLGISEHQTFSKYYCLKCFLESEVISIPCSLVLLQGCTLEQRDNLEGLCGLHQKDAERSAEVTRSWESFSAPGNGKQAALAPHTSGSSDFGVILMHSHSLCMLVKAIVSLAPYRRHAKLPSIL